MFSFFNPERPRKSKFSFKDEIERILLENIARPLTFDEDSLVIMKDLNGAPGVEKRGIPIVSDIFLGAHIRSGTPLFSGDFSGDFSKIYITFRESFGYQVDLLKILSAVNDGPIRVSEASSSYLCFKANIDLHLVPNIFEDKRYKLLKFLASALEDFEEKHASGCARLFCKENIHVPGEFFWYMRLKNTRREIADKFFQLGSCLSSGSISPSV